MLNVLFNALKEVCLGPTCIAAYLVVWFFGVWLLTAYARHKRVQRAAGNRTEIITQNILFIASPLLLILAGILALVALLVPIVVPAAVIVLAPLALLIFGGLALVEALPEIKQWIIDHLGPLGEKILSFITGSPRRPVEKLASTAGNATTLLETFLSRTPILRMLTRRTSAWIFQVTGLNRQSILLTAASNKKIPLKQRLIGVTGLTRLKDAHGLHRLACDPANHIEVRVQAVQALEALEDPQDPQRAAQGWHAIGRQRPDLVRRMQAASSLMRLGHPETARQILRDYLSHIYGDPKFHILAARLLASTGGEQTEAWRILKDYSEKRDPHLRLKAAAALCALERLDQPAETGQPASAAILQNLVVAGDNSLPLRQTAVKALEWHGCSQSLEELASQPGQDYHVQRKIILALQRLGNTGLAAHAWQELAQNTQAEPAQRILAAEAHGRLTDAESARTLLLNISREPDMQPTHLLEIAHALLRLGIVEEAEVFLRQLSDGLTSTDPVQKDARQTLRSLRSGHYGEQMKIDQIG